jgi:hypothetical protein
MLDEAIAKELFTADGTDNADLKWKPSVLSA